MADADVPLRSLLFLGFLADHNLRLGRLSMVGILEFKSETVMDDRVLPGGHLGRFVTHSGNSDPARWLYWHVSRHLPRPTKNRGELRPFN